jgi:hypothetical protein
MAAPVITPLLQWSDADGNPYAGGSIETYLPGTSTPKAVWIDPDQLAYASNPVIMDAAGRTLMYGDGEYRLVIRNATGDLVADIEATTIVSAAMAPVVSAPTIADAVHQLGIDDLIAAEAATRAAADSAEQAARIAADNTLTGLTTGLRTDLNNEITRATNRENDLQDQIDDIAAAVHLVQAGNAATDAGTGTVNVTFATPYSAPPIVVATVRGTALPAFWLAVNATAVGFTVWASIPLADMTVHPAAVGFNWIAAGTT